MGTLAGKIIICPLHFAQFDVTNGQKMKDPLPTQQIPGIPEQYKKMLEKNEAIRSKVKTYGLDTYAVKVEGEDILVDA